MAPELAAPPAPAVLAILDRQHAGTDTVWLDHLDHLWRDAPRDGSVWIQLRAKRLAREARLELLRRARALADGDGPPILVNGTSGDALATGFLGVHWPEALRPEEPPPLAARLRWICAAVHDLDGARAAQHAGAGLVTWSPVFAPRSKPDAGRGTEALATFVAHSPVPVLALGGVSPEGVRPCLDAGAAGVAVLSPVSTAGRDPVEAVRALLDASRA